MTDTIKKLIVFLKSNGFRLESVNYDDGDQDAKALFVIENLELNELNGNLVTDSSISVEIDFDYRLDDKSGVLLDDGDVQYDYDEQMLRSFIDTIKPKKIYGGRRDKKTRKNRKSKK